MTGTIIFWILLPIVIFYGIISSRNHLVRVNLGFLVAYIVLAILILLDKFTPLSFILNNVETWYNSLDNIFTQNIITSFSSFKALIFALIFTLVAVFCRILFHYVLLGKNPAYLGKKDKIFHSVNIVIFFIFSFLIESYAIAYFCLNIGWGYGTFEKWFQLIYKVTV